MIEITVTCDWITHWIGSAYSILTCTWERKTKKCYSGNLRSSVYHFVQIYKRENIPVPHIPFIDNEPILKLIEERPFGILNMLDEEVVVPEGSDAKFLLKVSQNQKTKFVSILTGISFAIPSQSSTIRSVVNRQSSIRSPKSCAPHPTFFCRWFLKYCLSQDGKIIELRPPPWIENVRNFLSPPASCPQY